MIKVLIVNFEPIKTINLFLFLIWNTHFPVGECQLSWTEMSVISSKLLPLQKDKTDFSGRYILILSAKRYFKFQLFQTYTSTIILKFV